MNDILYLKGRFEQRPYQGRGGGASLPANSKVKISDLEKLQSDLTELIKFWTNQSLLNGALISVYYNKVIAKSYRIAGLLSHNGIKANETIVGAKFSDGAIKKHIITHFVTIDSLRNSVTLLQRAINVLKEEFDGTITEVQMGNKEIIDSINYKNYSLVKTTFKQIISDAYYVEKFDIENGDVNIEKTSIVTIYETNLDTKIVLEKIGIKIFSDRIINGNTVLLEKNSLKLLLEKAPFLVAMATENLTELAPSDFNGGFNSEPVVIPDPLNEPTIGVIDTLFEESVYFNKWVEYTKMIDDDIPTTSKDSSHGTAVSSIIVDGPRLNPRLDDECGRFRVRHFGVATGSFFNSFSIIRSIREIIIDNPDIRVWNLSLGSNEEVNENFISAEGAVLDQLQYEYDVIFVVAGTNQRQSKHIKRIGAPADSINSMVVNSVCFDNKPASYSRKGIILSFFTKPDVSYYGGTADDYMNVCEPFGKAEVCGTSYAAPWIARKLSYLIDIMGLSKEVAKAMIIDAAIGWGNNTDLKTLSLKGHGIVPIKISEILQSSDEEIKFIVTGISEKYDTFNYNFPVPTNAGKHPYVVKATLCYFPKCSRNQGVDYTNTELDIYFGRIDNAGKFKSINNNTQSLDTNKSYLHEESARKLFRKWDNIKHINEKVVKSPKAKKAYSNPMWAMSIKTKERLNARDGEGIRFGVVVTLKEINGVNRIDDFIQQCSLKGWIVSRVNIEERIDIFETANEIIEFE